MKLKRILSLMLSFALILSLCTVSASAASVTYQGETFTYDDSLTQNEGFMTNLNVLLKAAEEQDFSLSLFELFFNDEVSLSNSDIETLVYYVDGGCYRTFAYELEAPGMEEAYYALIARYERGEIDSSEFNALYVDLTAAAFAAHSALQYESRMEEHGFTRADVVFDAETGTVLQVLNDAPRLYIPSIIDGEYVTAIAGGAITGKQQLCVLSLPVAVEIIDAVILCDCPKLEMIIDYASYLTVPYQNCPLLTLEPYEEYTTTANYQYFDYSLEEFREAELSKCFAVSSGTLRGDGRSYNWEGGLTRAEAITIIIRLMGLDEEAQAKAAEPAAFSDTSGHWAVGYANLAYELGITRGDGKGNFNPQGLCTAQDFVTMLFRLTQLKEGTDYSWGTILTDFRESVAPLDSFNNDVAGLNSTDGVCSAPLYLYAEDSANYILDYLNRGGTFTRLTAADIIFYMMNIVAGENYRSLADILAVDYGLNDASVYDNFIRRTAYGLPEDFPSRHYDSDYAYIHYYLSDERIAHLESVVSDSLPEFGANELADFIIELYYGRNFEEFTALAVELTENCSTEYEKAKAISRWVAEHIYYDYDALAGKHLSIPDAEGVLRERRAVCEGYANLTRAMLLAVGIKVVRESGVVGSEGHAWNVAKLDGEWVVLDNTWDSRLEYRNGTFYCRDNYDHELIEAENYLEPNSTWRDEYFDSDFEDFYGRHILERSPSMELDAK